MVLLLNLRLVSELQRLDFLSLLLSHFLRVVFGDPQVVWQLKLANNSVLLLLLLALELGLLALVLFDLVCSYTDVVEWHDLLVVESCEAHSEPDLVPSHVSPSESFCFVCLETLLYEAVVPHAACRIDGQTGSPIPQKVFIDAGEASDL